MQQTFFHLQQKLHISVGQPCAREWYREAPIVLWDDADRGHVERWSAHGRAGRVDQVDAVVDGGGGGASRAPVEHQGGHRVGDDLVADGSIDNEIDMTEIELTKLTQAWRRFPK